MNRDIGIGETSGLAIHEEKMRRESRKRRKQFLFVLLIIGVLGYYSYDYISSNNFNLNFFKTNSVESLVLDEINNYRIEKGFNEIQREPLLDEFAEYSVRTISSKYASRSSGSTAIEFPSHLIEKLHNSKESNCRDTNFDGVIFQLSLIPSGGKEPDNKIIAKHIFSELKGGRGYFLFGEDVCSIGFSKTYLEEIDNYVFVYAYRDGAIN